MKQEGPITGEQIAERLSLTRATLRPDLSILTMAGFLDARPRVGYFYSGKTANQLLKEHIYTLYVKDYFARPVVIEESKSVYDAICSMFLDDVGTLIVVNKKSYLTGIISRKDLLKATMGSQDVNVIPVSVVMTRMPNIVTCDPADTLHQAASQMMRHQIDALPVVRVAEEDASQMEVIGRITKTTIAKAFVELGENMTI